MKKRKTETILEGFCLHVNMILVSCLFISTIGICNNCSNVAMLWSPTKYLFCFFHISN